MIGAEYLSARVLDALWANCAAFEVELSDPNAACRSF